MTSPIPGFTYPSPISWSANTAMTAPRLRADMTNMGLLYAGGPCRPMLVSSPAPNQWFGGLLVLNTTTASLNTWNVILGTPSAPLPYNIPFAGFWLLQGGFVVTPTSVNAKYAPGVTIVGNGSAPSNVDLAASGGCGAGGASPAGASGAELFQFNTFANTGDQFNLFAYTNQNVNQNTISFAYIQAEWVGLPTSGLTSYTGPYGTVVSSPVPALPWPSGPGAFITSGIAAGATSLTVSDATGMIAGGTLGLDIINGQFYRPVAEAVTITSVSGTAIGISATQYAHAQSAPVAVPVSSPFLNQQVRDAVRFLAYPPILRATQTSVQSIASGSNVQITMGVSADTFSGFASNQYTVPVSGVYLVIGAVYLNGSTTAFTASAGVSVSGTITWGDRFRVATTGGSQTICPVVRRHLRLTAGQTVQLIGFQNSGSSMNTIASGSTFSKLILVWRSF